MLNRIVSAGRIAGIPLKVDLSWFIIFFLVAVFLVRDYFLVLYPDWGWGLTISVGIASSLLFTLSVLAHELSHSLVAQRSGISTGPVVLFAFGGMAQMKEPRNPKAELRIALAGPALSFVIGLAFTAIGLLFLARSDAISAIAIWLGGMNVILAVFNLIPAFPMDGGRVLRAILWRRSNNRAQSTRVACISGVVVGLFLVVFGFWVFFSGYYLASICVILTGWFLTNAARSEHELISVQQALKGHCACEAMGSCVTVPLDTTVEALVKDHARLSNPSYYVVANDGNTLGIVTWQDIKRISPRERANRRAAEFMRRTNEFPSVGPDDDLLGVMDQLEELGVDQMPVVSNGKLVGLIGSDHCRSLAKSLMRPTALG